ncbi:MAG: hypothetical protein PHP13_03165, partial [Methanomicrobium sp.]|nr:hypothetical protein [Methanomicrobium sp.]
SDIIKNGIANIDGAVFESGEVCPFCGGALRGHDTKKKKFASNTENNQRRNIFVNVKRSRCTNCKKLVYAKAPFYENTRVGSPIADFCLVNLKIHPANHISKILKKLNILISPAAVRNLSSLKTEEIVYIDFHGIFFPLSLLNLSENLKDENFGGVNLMMLQMMKNLR